MPLLHVLQIASEKDTGKWGHQVLYSWKSLEMMAQLLAQNSMYGLMRLYLYLSGLKWDWKYNYSVIIALSRQLSDVFIYCLNIWMIALYAT